MLSSLQESEAANANTIHNQSPTASETVNKRDEEEWNREVAGVAEAEPIAAVGAENKEGKAVEAEDVSTVLPTYEEHKGQELCVSKVLASLLPRRGADTHNTARGGRTSHMPRPPKSTPAG